jgi:hypothetical protein
MTTGFQTPFSPARISLIQVYQARHGRKQWDDYAGYAGERAAYLHACRLETREDPRIADIVTKPLAEQARALDLSLTHIAVQRGDQGYVHGNTAYPLKEQAVAAKLRDEGRCVIHDEGGTFSFMVHALAQDIMSRIYFLLHPEEFKEFAPQG